MPDCDVTSGDGADDAGDDGRNRVRAHEGAAGPPPTAQHLDQVEKVGPAQHVYGGR